MLPPSTDTTGFAPAEMLCCTSVSKLEVSDGSTGDGDMLDLVGGDIDALVIGAGEEIIDAGAAGVAVGSAVGVISTVGTSVDGGSMLGDEVSVREKILGFTN